MPFIRVIGYLTVVKVGRVMCVIRYISSVVRELILMINIEDISNSRYLERIKMRELFAFLDILLV